jgi:hypothetical protein
MKRHEVRAWLIGYGLPVAAGGALVGLGFVARRWPKYVSEQGAMIWVHDAVRLLQSVFIVVGIFVIGLTHRRWKDRSRDDDGGH